MIEHPDGPDPEAKPNAACGSSVGSSRVIGWGDAAALAQEPGKRFESERDEYDELLAALGRSFDEDVRIAIHDAGHAVCGRLLGRELGGVTITPDATRGYGGLCWSVGYTEAFANAGDASNVRAVLTPLMPQAGEDRSSVADVFGHVYSRCIGLMAGRAAERMLLEGEPVVPADDLRQGRELALLICKTEQAIETFLAHCDVVARDLLWPYADLLMVLSTVLRIKRTLDGPEIDQIIIDVEARKALAREHQRRADWRKGELTASSFRAICTPLDNARLPHFAPDQVR
jgi:hypothetical protein